MDYCDIIYFGADVELHKRLSGWTRFYEHVAKAYLLLARTLREECIQLDKTCDVGESRQPGDNINHAVCEISQLLVENVHGSAAHLENTWTGYDQARSPWQLLKRLDNKFELNLHNRQLALLSAREQDEDLLNKVEMKYMQSVEKWDHMIIKKNAFWTKSRLENKLTQQRVKMEQCYDTYTKIYDKDIVYRKTFSDALQTLEKQWVQREEYIIKHWKEANQIFISQLEKTSSESIRSGFEDLTRDIKQLDVPSLVNYTLSEKQEKREFPCFQEHWKSLTSARPDRRKTSSDSGNDSDENRMYMCCIKPPPKTDKPSKQMSQYKPDEDVEKAEISPRISRKDQSKKERLISPRRQTSESPRELPKRTPAVLPKYIQAVENTKLNSLETTSVSIPQKTAKVIVEVQTPPNVEEIPEVISIRQSKKDGVESNNNDLEIKLVIAFEGLPQMTPDQQTTCMCCCCSKKNATCCQDKWRQKSIYKRHNCMHLESSEAESADALRLHLSDEKECSTSFKKSAKRHTESARNSLDLNNTSRRKRTKKRKEVRTKCLNVQVESCSESDSSGVEWSAGVAVHQEKQESMKDQDYKALSSKPARLTEPVVVELGTKTESTVETKETALNNKHTDESCDRSFSELDEKQTSFLIKYKTEDVQPKSETEELYTEVWDSSSSEFVNNENLESKTETEDTKVDEIYTEDSSSVEFVEIKKQLALPFKGQTKDMKSESKIDAEEKHAKNQSSWDSSSSERQTIQNPTALQMKMLTELEFQKQESVNDLEVKDETNQKILKSALSDEFQKSDLEEINVYFYEEIKAQRIESCTNVETITDKQPTNLSNDGEIIHLAQVVFEEMLDAAVKNVIKYYKGAYLDTGVLIDKKVETVISVPENKLSVFETSKQIEHEIEQEASVDDLRAVLRYESETLENELSSSASLTGLTPEEEDDIVLENEREPVEKKDEQEESVDALEIMDETKSRILKTGNIIKTQKADLQEKRGVTFCRKVKVQEIENRIDVILRRLWEDSEEDEGSLNPEDDDESFSWDEEVKDNTLTNSYSEYLSIGPSAERVYYSDELDEKDILKLTEPERSKPCVKPVPQQTDELLEPKNVVEEIYSDDFEDSSSAEENDKTGPPEKVKKFDREEFDREVIENPQMKEASSDDDFECEKASVIIDDWSINCESLDEKEMSSPDIMEQIELTTSDELLEDEVQLLNCFNSEAEKEQEVKLLGQSEQHLDSVSLSGEIGDQKKSINHDIQQMQLTGPSQEERQLSSFPDVAKQPEELPPPSVREFEIDREYDGKDDRSVSKERLGNNDDPVTSQQILPQTHVYQPVSGKPRLIQEETCCMSIPSNILKISDNQAFDDDSDLYYESSEGYLSPIQPSVEPPVAQPRLTEFDSNENMFMTHVHQPVNRNNVLMTHADQVESEDGISPRLELIPRGGMLAAHSGEHHDNMFMSHVHQASPQTVHRDNMLMTHAYHQVESEDDISPQLELIPRGGMLAAHSEEHDNMFMTHVHQASSRKLDAEDVPQMHSDSLQVGGYPTSDSITTALFEAVQSLEAPSNQYDVISRLLPRRVPLPKFQRSDCQIRPDIFVDDVLQNPFDFRESEMEAPLVKRVEMPEIVKSSRSLSEEKRENPSSDKRSKQELLDEFLKEKKEYERIPEARRSDMISNNLSIPSISSVLPNKQIMADPGKLNFVEALETVDDARKAGRQPGVVIPQYPPFRANITNTSSDLLTLHFEEPIPENTRERSLLLNRRAKVDENWHPEFKVTDLPRLMTQLPLRQTERDGSQQDDQPEELVIKNHVSFPSKADKISPGFHGKSLPSDYTRVSVTCEDRNVQRFASGFQKRLRKLADDLKDISSAIKLTSPQSPALQSHGIQNKEETSKTKGILKCEDRNVQRFASGFQKRLRKLADDLKETIKLISPQSPAVHPPSRATTKYLNMQSVEPEIYTIDDKAKSTSANKFQKTLISSDDISTILDDSPRTVLKLEDLKVVSLEAKKHKSSKCYWL